MSRTLGDKKEKRKEIFNRRKLLLRKDLGVAACPADLSLWGVRVYVDLAVRVIIVPFLSFVRLPIILIILIIPKRFFIVFPR
jgi:hypothetical protein